MQNDNMSGGNKSAKKEDRGGKKGDFHIQMSEQDFKLTFIQKCQIRILN